MTGYQMFLVVLGLVIIAISYILSEKATQKKELVQFSKEYPNGSILTDLETSDFKVQINNIIKEELDSIVYKTEDELSKISNEKIMAVSEYSDQILEKINQNHTEVVFLYNMLNEKEISIKKTFKRDDDLKNNKEHNTVQSNSNNIQMEKLIEENISIDNLEIIDQLIKNEEILTLYSEGKTIMEIAKLLETGQGEIKLVIDLSQGVNK